MAAALRAVLRRLAGDDGADIELASDSANALAVAQGRATSTANLKLGALLQVASELLARLREAKFARVNSRIGHPRNDLAEDVVGISTEAPMSALPGALVDEARYSPQAAWELPLQEHGVDRAARPALDDGIFAVHRGPPVAASRP